MLTPTYIPLSVHSSYSLSEGAITIPRLLTFCQDQKIPAVALTDTFNLFGAMEFSLEAIKKGIQPILGTKVWLEIPLLENTTAAHTNEQGTYYHPITLLVINEDGYHNLTKIISRAYRQRHPLKPLFIPHQDMIEFSAGLIALSGKINSPHFKILNTSQQRLELSHCMTSMNRLFPGNLYIDLNRYGFQEEYQIENDIIAMAQDNSIPLVATNEAYFINENEYEAHDALLCIAAQTVVRDQTRRRLTPHHRLKSPAEMATVFRDLPEALSNSLLIAKRCNFILEATAPRLPVFCNAQKRN